MSSDATSLFQNWVFFEFLKDPMIGQYRWQKRTKTIALVAFIAIYVHICSYIFIMISVFQIIGYIQIIQN
jgi:hypothetical protein